VKSHNTWPS